MLLESDCFKLSILQKKLKEDAKNETLTNTLLLAILEQLMHIAN